MLTIDPIEHSSCDLSADEQTDHEGYIVQPADADRLMVYVSPDRWICSEHQINDAIYQRLVQCEKLNNGLCPEEQQHAGEGSSQYKVDRAMGQIILGVQLFITSIFT